MESKILSEKETYRRKLDILLNIHEKLRQQKQELTDKNKKLLEKTAPLRTDIDVFNKSPSARKIFNSLSDIYDLECKIHNIRQEKMFQKHEKERKLDLNAATRIYQICQELSKEKISREANSVPENVSTDVSSPHNVSSHKVSAVSSTGEKISVEEKTDDENLLTVVKNSEKCFPSEAEADTDFSSSNKQKEGEKLSPNKNYDGTAEENNNNNNNNGEVFYSMDKTERKETTFSGHSASDNHSNTLEKCLPNIQDKPSTFEEFHSQLRVTEVRSLCQEPTVGGDGDDGDDDGGDDDDDGDGDDAIKESNIPEEESL